MTRPARAIGELLAAIRTLRADLAKVTARDKLASLLERAADELHESGMYSQTHLAERIDTVLGHRRFPPRPEFLASLERRLGPADPVLTQEEAEAEYRRIVAAVVDSSFTEGGA